MQIVADAGCPWTAQSSTSFIRVTDNATGAGGGNVRFTVLDNGGPPRTASATIAWPTGSQSIEVRQASLPLKAIISAPAVCQINQKCLLDGRGSTGAISGYLWDLGDGQRAFGSTVEWVYDEDFVYGDGFEGERDAVVTLTIIAPDGQRDSTTAVVTVVDRSPLSQRH